MDMIEARGVEGSVSTTIADERSSVASRSIMILVGFGAAAIITLFFMAPAFACSATDGFVVSPPTAFPDTPVDASGDGYPASTQVTITLGTRNLATVMTDEKQHFATSFVVPADLSPGEYSVVATPATGGRAIAATLTVRSTSNDPRQRAQLSEATPTPAPQKATAPTSGSPAASPVPAGNPALTPSSPAGSETERPLAAFDPGKSVTAISPNDSATSAVATGSATSAVATGSATPSLAASPAQVGFVLPAPGPGGTPALSTSHPQAMPLGGEGRGSKVAEGVPPSLSWSAVGRGIDSTASAAGSQTGSGFAWVTGLLVGSVVLTSGGLVLVARRRKAIAPGSDPERS